MSCNNKITLADLDEMTAEEIVALLPPDFLEREREAQADVEDALDPIEAYKRDPQNAASDRYKRIAARAEDAQVGR